MKTKKKTYVLLVLVVAVWGTIAYKVLSALNPELPEMQEQSFAVNSNYKLNIEIDTFSIKTVNRDPFLGTLLKKPTKPVVKRKKEVRWPTIDYHGSIKQNKSKAQIFIISINGTQYLLKKGQTRDSIVLANGNETSVTLYYKNQSKRYNLNKRQ